MGLLSGSNVIFSFLPPSSIGVNSGKKEIAPRGELTKNRNQKKGREGGIDKESKSEKKMVGGGGGGLGGVSECM